MPSVKRTLDKAIKVLDVSVSSAYSKLRERANSASSKKELGEILLKAEKARSNSQMSDKEYIMLNNVLKKVASEKGW